MLNHCQITRIYLDELGDLEEQPVGISLMQLAIANEATLTHQARNLIDRVEREAISPAEKQAIIEVVTTIAVYKFSRLSREEVEAMLGLRLEDTRVYREAKEEGREEGRMEILATTIPLLLQTGLTIEQIAQQLRVEVEMVRQLSQQL